MAKKTKKRAAPKKRKAPATPHDRKEVAYFQRTLEANQQIAHGEELTPGTTHQIELDADGRETVVRKRFSSI